MAKKKSKKQGKIKIISWGPNKRSAQIVLQIPASDGKYESVTRHVHRDNRGHYLHDHKGVVESYSL